MKQGLKDVRDGIIGAVGGAGFGLVIAYLIAIFFGVIEPVPNCKPGNFTSCIHGARR